MPLGIVIEKVCCTGCQACGNACPGGCIRMLPDEQGFRCPVVSRKDCTGCSRCSVVCPAMNPPFSEERQPEAFICKPNEEGSGFSFSSAELFRLLAQRTLEEGGVVFGVCLNEKREPVYTFAEQAEQLAAFADLRYIESDVGLSFRQAGEFLKAGRKVLFWGLPCRIAGLRNYLDTDDENLLCVDTVCCGVRSGEEGADCLLRLERRYGIPVSAVRLHNGADSSGSGFVSVVLQNGRTVAPSLGEQPYLQKYFLSPYLRPSCHQCPFKTMRSCSDITLADSTAYTSSASGQGAAVLVVNTSRGADVLKTLSGRFKSVKMEAKNIPRLFCAAPKPQKTHALIKKIRGVDFAAFLMRLRHSYVAVRAALLFKKACVMALHGAKAAARGLSAKVRSIRSLITAWVTRT